MRLPFVPSAQPSPARAARFRKAVLVAGFASLLLGLGVQLGCAGASAGASPSPTDVYVAGDESNGQVLVAKYWKNGTAVALTNGAHNARAFAIAVSGQDVYVAGGESNERVDVAMVWKNGTPVALTDGTNQAFAVGLAVSGADVYVTGYECDPSRYGVAVAKVWKNGVPTALTDGSGMAQANAVAIDGADVHVAGWEYQVNQIDPSTWLFSAQAVYWKNGLKTTLTNVSRGGGALGITLSGGDVYVSGNEFVHGLGIAHVWKNGQATALTDGSRGADAAGVAVADGIVYAPGSENAASGLPVAMLWKDAAPTVLASARYPSFANGVALSPTGSSVFVVGTVYGPAAATATYWQDGQRHDLTDGTADAEANAITVVRRPLF
ncbi:hypothetical protein GETHPA_12040 [Geothrix rubra]|uniref:Uncharacterized protein n=1 Tax=Geothrix rubra TaxID=2927977 RepID=A0ABQ5Q5R6_9BACT|nr:hypothetical protein [Geothrix rubra]GLH69671.1 hypothetical protein GETHPA_12040 [Geothrix rubra]